jgi:predicted ArsR family transcriptional regulator
MILQRLLSFLERHPAASAGEIARGIGASPDAARGMLATLERRGRVERCAPLPACGGCGICGQSAEARYRLTGTPRRETSPCAPPTNPPRF